MRIEPFSFVAPLGPPDVFLAGEIELDAAALPTMQGLSPAARRNLTEAITPELSEELHAVTERGEVAMSFHTLIAHAYR